jgi:DNA-binding transcriptional LysR family regulator
MDYILLKYFITVAEELSFSKAAQRLHISQPPLTRAISKLEYQLGLKLFERTTRQVTLTPHGRYLLHEAKRLLDEMERTARAVRHATTVDSSRFGIGYTCLGLYTILPKVLDYLKLNYPNVELDLIEYPSRELKEALLNVELDLAIVLLPLKSSTLEFVPIHAERMKIAVSKDHLLANEAKIRLDQLATEQFIIHAKSENPSMYDDIFRCCQAAGFSPHILEKKPEQNCLALIRAGQGVHFVSPSMECMKPEGVVYVEVEDPVPMIELALCYRKEDPSPLLKGLLHAKIL